MKADESLARRDLPHPFGMELFDVTPAIVGGDPANPENKVWLTREQHVKAVRYWNEVVSRLREHS